MAEQPNAVSQRLTFDTFEKKPHQTSTKEDPLNFSPNSPLTCVEATVKAAAEQKPEITGADMSSTIKPRNPQLNTVFLQYKTCLAGKRSRNTRLTEVEQSSDQF